MGDEVREDAQRSVRRLVQYLASFLDRSPSLEEWAAGVESFFANHHNLNRFEFFNGFHHEAAKISKQFCRRQHQMARVNLVKNKVISKGKAVTATANSDQFSRLQDLLGRLVSSSLAQLGDDPPLHKPPSGPSAETNIFLTPANLQNLLQLFERESQESLRMLLRCLTSDVMGCDCWGEIVAHLRESLAVPALSKLSLKFIAKCLSSMTLQSADVFHVLATHTAPASLEMAYLIDRYCVEVPSLWLRLPRGFSERVICLQMRNVISCRDYGLRLSLVDWEARWLRRWLHGNYSRRIIYKFLRENVNLVSELEGHLRGRGNFSTEIHLGRYSASQLEYLSFYSYANIFFQLISYAEGINLLQSRGTPITRIIMGIHRIALRETSESLSLRAMIESYIMTVSGNDKTLSMVLPPLAEDVSFLQFLESGDSQLLELPNHQIEYFLRLCLYIARGVADIGRRCPSFCGRISAFMANICENIDQESYEKHNFLPLIPRIVNEIHILAENPEFLQKYFKFLLFVWELLSQKEIRSLTPIVDDLPGFSDFDELQLWKSLVVDVLFSFPHSSSVLLDCQDLRHKIVKYLLFQQKPYKPNQSQAKDQTRKLSSIVLNHNCAIAMRDCKYFDLLLSQIFDADDEDIHSESAILSKQTLLSQFEGMQFHYPSLRILVGGECQPISEMLHICLEKYPPWVVSPENTAFVALYVTAIMISSLNTFCLLEASYNFVDGLKEFQRSRDFVDQLHEKRAEVINRIEVVGGPSETSHSGGESDCGHANTFSRIFEKSRLSSINLMKFLLSKSSSDAVPRESSESKDDFCRVGTDIAVAYGRRLGMLGGESAKHQEDLMSVLGSFHGESLVARGYDWVAATVFIACGGDKDESRVLLSRMGEIPSCDLFWRMSRGDSLLVGTLVERIVEIELPRVTVAFRSSFVPLIAVIRRWQSQMLWNYVDFDHILCLLNSCLVFGAQAQIYYFVAILSFYESAIHRYYRDGQLESWLLGGKFEGLSLVGIAPVAENIKIKYHKLVDAEFNNP